ncbi:MAG: ubiquinone/menaquinone biosynthesis methyltransferase [Thermoplasmata archaeon]|nr:ubiquinone/menaquinone biosynthesis methyltransferase [Thermoplasmata archaeon]MCI4362124.1 ubiquinone/menaquinone biosynthesis methyltransferase [Thermoplasmata archaeon]
MSAPGAHRTAADGSPYPDRTDPAFEHDVRAMFDAIADGYDTFDHVASLGQDLLWRPRALWALDRFRTGKPTVRRALDVGCGTGDLTRLTARHYRGADVVGADFTARMLTLASHRSRGPVERRSVRYGRASALGLPFKSGTFDVVLSAFVVRNLPRLDDAFRELRRVLTDGGTLLTLEITEPSSPAVARLFHAYFDAVVPWLGVAVGRSGPYRYLPESLRHLPPRSEMLGRLRAAGFDPVVAVPQSQGIVTTYLAEAASRR